MTEKSVILIVCSNPANLELMGQQFGQEGYDTVNAASLEELDQALLRAPSPISPSQQLARPGHRGLHESS